MPFGLHGWDQRLRSICSDSSSKCLTAERDIAESRSDRLRMLCSLCNSDRKRVCGKVIFIPQAPFLHQ